MKAVRLLWLPSPERGEFAFRVGLAAVLTTYLVMYYQTPEPALTAYLVFFLNKPDRMSSLLTQVTMMLVITTVTGAVLLISTGVIDSPFWRIIAMTVLSIGLLFLGSASKLKPVAATIALIAGYSLGLLGSAPAGEAATRGFLYVWLIVAMAAGASLLVTLLAGPAPVSFARRKIGQRLNLALQAIESPEPGHHEAIQTLLSEGNKAINTWLNLTVMEHTSSDLEIDKIRRLSSISFEILMFLSVPRDARLPVHLRTALEDVLGELSGQLKDGQPLRTILLPPMLRKADADETWGAVAEGLVFSLNAYNQPPSQPEHLPNNTTPPGFFLPDAFSNPAHLHYALKTTGAAMSCYILYTLLNWPGIHTCFITCYVVSLGTTAESIAKLRLRIAGCLFGTALGVSVLIGLMPSISSIESLLWIVFTGTFLAGWVSAGVPAISYAGFQIAFAFYLCVLQGASPEFDLAVARDRVMGVLLGNFVAYIFLTGLWPVSIGERLDKKLLEFFRSLQTLNRDSAADFYFKARQLQSDMELARLEPVEIRPDLKAIQLRERMVHSGLSAGANVVLSPKEHSPELARFVQDLASRLAGQPVSLMDSNTTASLTPPGLPSLQKLDELLRQLHPLAKSDSHA